MNKKKILSALLTLAMTLLLAACSDTTVTETAGTESRNTSVQDTTGMNTESEKEVTQLVVTINGKEFTATLEDTQAAKELTEMLPLTLTMSEMNGNEKYGDLPTGLTQDVYAPGEIHAGDILLWGSDTLVLFYESFSSSYSYTAVGYLDDPSGIKDAVGSGNAEVTISY